jgi:hypothetical protein
MEDSVTRKVKAAIAEAKKPGSKKIDKSLENVGLPKNYVSPLKRFITNEHQAKNFMKLLKGI